MLQLHHDIHSQGKVNKLMQRFDFDSLVSIKNKSLQYIYIALRIDNDNAKMLALNLNICLLMRKI